MNYSQDKLLSIKEASDWASSYLNREVTTSNISYLIQYGRVRRVNNNGNIEIPKRELKKYYDSYLGKREVSWTNQLGDDLNWALSFDNLREADTTKHVHRLHPYKGKFIPQLVEYFLDDHTDQFKQDVYFNEGDIVLDPFCGSGTALVEANELGIHAIGIDISEFNSFISNVKVGKYDLQDIQYETNLIINNLKKMKSLSNIDKFDKELDTLLSEFNAKFFPSPEYKYKVRTKQIDGRKYGMEKERAFLPIYRNLLEKYNLKLQQSSDSNFLDKWYVDNVRREIDFVFNMVKDIKNVATKKVVALILSRTIRSCRATTHSDLATLKEPTMTTYYCRKHGKICRPLFSIEGWFSRYARDTIRRLKQFDNLRTPTHQICLNGDSRNINIFEELKDKDNKLYELTRDKKIKGIFSSPPYVGLIDYHEQHAYAYDLFGFNRYDNLEIGPLFKGRGKEARNSYVKGVSKVLINCIKYLQDDFHIFLVANDRYNLYPTIAKNAGLKIVNQFKRPVLNRTEKDKNAYSEIIFHMKGE